MAEADDYFASPEQTLRGAQYPTRYNSNDAARNDAPPTAERAAAASQATLASMRHVVSEYARRVVQEELAVHDDATECQFADIEFVPATRCTNDLACFALFGATMFSLLPIMTHIVIVVLGAGAVTTYALDLLGHRGATLFAMCGTLIAGWLAFYFANFSDAWGSPSALMIVISVALIFLMVGLRAAMSFKHIQVTSPGFVLMCDALVNTCLPLVCTPPLIATVVGVCGARLAAFALVPVVCVIHFAFYRPMQSSFLEVATDSRRKAAERLVMLVGPVEAAVGTAFVVLLPAIMYPALTNDALTWSVFNVFNYIFLLCGPLFYMVAVDPRLTLWFLREVKIREVEIAATISVGDEEAAGDGDARAATVRVYVTALDVIAKWRYLLAFVFYSGIMHFAVERLINSRFAYLVVALVPPFNYLALVVVGYLASGAALCVVALVAMDAAEAKGGSTDAKKKKTTSSAAVLWVCALLFSVGCGIVVGIVTGMPGFFIPMLALSAASFAAYLIDRRGTNNFVSFMCASTITLTWWMFKTFSFVRQDLRVIGEKFSTNEVAGGALLAYIMGGICIPLAFSKNKGPLVVVMVLHGLKIMFLEHVLYSQPESSAYPPYFVFATSFIGCAVAYRMYRNELLSDIIAAYLMGLYASKVFVYLVQINVAENENETYAMEMFITELFSMAAAAVLAIAELRHRAGTNITTPQFLSVLSCWFIVLAAGMRDTVVRLVVEHVGFNRPSAIQLTAASGVACAFFGLVLAGRYTTRVRAEDTPEEREATAAAGVLRARLRKNMGYALAVCATLLVVDPSLEALATGEGMEAVADDALTPPWWSRWAVAAALGLIYLAARLPVNVPSVVRGGLLVVLSVLLSLAATPIVIPGNDVRVVACLAVFFAMSAVTLAACHYGRFESDVCLVLYLVSLLALAVGFISLGWLDKSVPIEAEVMSRMGFLSIAAATNLLMALCLKSYLNGKALFAGTRKLEPAEASQVALVLNYAVVICFTTLSLLAYWVEAEPSSMLVAASAVLLLLHNDAVIFVRLSKGPFRYFPPFVAACVTLLWHSFHEMRDFASAGRPFRAGLVVAGVVALLPSHLSLARFLFVTRKRKTTVARVLLLVVWDGMILLATPSHGVRWLSAVGIVALVGRLIIAGHFKPIADIAAM